SFIASSWTHADGAIRGGAVVLAAAAEGAVDVGTPAIDLDVPCLRHARAGVRAAGGDLERLAVEEDLDRGVRHLGGPVAELTAVVAAPAERDGAAGVVGDGAGVLGTGGDLAGRSGQLHLDRRQVLVDAEPGSQLSE